MNHRIIFCLVLILGNLLAISADCLDSNPGDVDYDCTNDVEEVRHEDTSDEKIDDIVDELPEYPDHNDLEHHENPSEHTESTSTSTTEKSMHDDEAEYDYDSEEHEESVTQQDDNNDSEDTEMQNDIDEDLMPETTTTIQTPTVNENDQRIDLFYNAIKTTLMSENYTNAYRFVKHPERIECMITDMRKSKVMDKISNKTYVFESNAKHEVKFELRNVTTFMYDLERDIQDANFYCTHMGNSRIYILIFVAILAVILLVLYIRRR